MDTSVLRLQWRKSTYSAANGSCVEVGTAPGVRGVRDTKDRAGRGLTFDQQEWTSFLAAIKQQRYDPAS